MTRRQKLHYFRCHYRVRTVRGQPNLCEHCGDTKPETRYQWASMTKNYADVSDYIRLCITCHIEFDQIGRINEAAFKERYSGTQV